MTTDIREKIARQLELEDESRTLGAERYRSQRPLPWRDSAAGVSEEGELPPGRQLIRTVIPPVAAAISEFVDRVAEGGAGRRPAAFKILGFVEPEAAAYLAARVVLNGAVFGHAVQTTAFEIADRPKGLLLFPYSGSFLWYRWKVIVGDVQKMGYDLSDVVLHSFRHTCLTRLSEQGLPIEKVADWAGHSDIQITMKHYRHAEASSLDIGASLLA